MRFGWHPLDDSVTDWIQRDVKEHQDFLKTLNKAFNVFLLFAWKDQLDHTAAGQEQTGALLVKAQAIWESAGRKVMQTTFSLWSCNEL